MQHEPPGFEAGSLGNVANPRHVPPGFEGGSLGNLEPNHAPPVPTPTHHDKPTVRDELHAYMTATATGKYDWQYREIRPLQLPPLLSHGVEADCSFGVKILCHWAGVQDDPTGEQWDGYGNSSSIFAHLPHVSVAEAKVGDIVVIGPGGEYHAAMILATDPENPKLWSFGHQGAPNVYPLLSDTRRPFTVCRIPAP